MDIFGCNAFREVPLGVLGVYLEPLIFHWVVVEKDSL